MIVTGGGKSDLPGKVIFNATFTYLADSVSPNSYLYSYYEIDSPKDYEYLQYSYDRGDRILIDSGAHGIYQALIRSGSLSFRDREINITQDILKYLDEYCLFLSENEPYLWGYVELDLGTQDQKTILRNYMQDKGLYPIPVFHPIVDSVEYLNHLCSNYDRVCFGNIATEPEAVREIILYLMSQTKSRYPHLWLHALGIAPHPFLAAFPFIDSCDSSSSSSLIRFGRFSEGACFDPKFRVVDDFCNRREDRDNYRLGAAVGYRSYQFHQAGWNRYSGGLYD